MAVNSEVDVLNIRRKLSLIIEDLREIRDQGKKTINDPSQVWLFVGMMSSISDMYQSYDALYHDLCDTCNGEGDSIAGASDHIQRSNAKRYFHESNGYLASINDSKSRESTSSAGNTSLGLSTSFKTKLPVLELPKFKGDRTQWPRFKDTFCSLIKDDPQLRNIDKFHYLIHSLEGSPLSVIAQIPVVEANFDIAWDTLEETYDNKRLLATTYLEQLFDMKKLTAKPNAATLTTFVSTASESVAAFKLLDIPERIEFIYFYLVNRCLDPHTREQFELQNTDTFPSFDKLIKFLRSRCTAAELANGLTTIPSVRDVSQTREALKHSSIRSRFGSGKTSLMTQVGKNTSNFGHDRVSAHRPAQSFVKRNPLSCFVCKGPHLLANCVKFSNASVSERHRLLQSWKGCRNCLHFGHVSFNCPSQYVCKFCKGRHHSLLHGYSSNSKTPVKQSTSNNISSCPVASGSSSKVASDDGEPGMSVSLSTSSRAPHDVMLGTAISNIADQDGIFHRIRLVIDSGSHFSFITQTFAKFLGLPIEPHPTGLWGIGETPFKGFIGRTHCTLRSTHSGYPVFKTTALVVNTITSSLPGFDSTKEFWQPYLNFDLADPEFWLTRPVDFLIGCDLFPQILTGQLVSVVPDMPKLLGTVFGFSVLGQVQDLSEVANYCSLHSISGLETEALNQQLNKFWEIEDPPSVSLRDPEDERCEALFVSTHYRLPTGRYVVRLPFKTPSPQIHGTRALAIRRLEHLESKLERHGVLRSKYTEFMREYLNLGHMTLAKQPGKVFIPHHCVTKGDGSEFKLRVVFDAAARTSSGSLNDYLLVGPKLQTSIVDIALNFRQYPFVFTTDVVKMFRQVLIHEDDRQYQHILWRFDPMEAVQEYELQTVTYGTASAPYLAIRALRQVIEDEGAAFPLAAQVLRSDVYVDDLVTGARTLPAAMELQRQVVALLAKGEFTLGKWSANHPLLLKIAQVPDSLQLGEPVSLDSSENSTVKILGLQWNPETDSFSYKIHLPEETICTKRAVLSTLIRIYDPLGYLGPCVVLAKQLVQEAWKLQLAWDQEFPPELKQHWIHFISSLPSLERFSIPRWIVPNDGPFDIVIFADASEKAYCAVAYLRSMTNDKTNMNLLFAKTKLAPVKTLTIPRLELCAALLAARLWQSLHIFCSNLPSRPRVFFFSDSMVVLSWLRTPVFKLKTFVANRVSKILELTDSVRWHHVNSCENPSDLGSRGILPDELIHNKLWMHGPYWTLFDYDEWPVTESLDGIELPELKTNPNLALVSLPAIPLFVNWFSRFSNFNRLLRSMAYVLRFIHNCQRHNVQVEALSLEEIAEAKRMVVKVAQRHSFFGNSISDSTVPKELASLSPFFDEAGLLVVGGRLKHANFSWGSKHPWILPGKSHISKLIVERFHKSLCHPGPTLLLGVLRQHFWITGARLLVRSVTHNCVTCRRFDARPLQPPMGDLPSVRFGEGRAFLHTGIDFAGPFMIKESLRRKASSSKVYLCLFVCLSTKALHLELVSSLSTEAFISALDRFIGRRGLPERIMTDNGTNFVGAANELKDLYRWYSLPATRETLRLYAVQRELVWTFIPPSAPFFGGLWEAGVKSVKRLLRGVYGDNLMTFEEMMTWLIKIEAILNSRPLCPLSNDPTDLDYLSPGHFLIGTPLLSPPEKSLLHLKENRLSRWQLVRQKSEHFWSRWRTEYLTTLQVRTKWRHPEYNITEGDLVLIKEENAPRLHWPTGRVVEVYPGVDGVVRVCLVKTPHSTLKRPTAKLIPLFIPTSTTTPTLDLDSTNVSSLTKEFSQIKIS